MEEEAVTDIIKSRLEELNKQVTTYDHEEHSRLGRIDELEELANKLHLQV